MNEPDTRIVYSLGCTFWGGIHQTSKHPGTGLPCCPDCHSMLCELEGGTEWWRGVYRYAALHSDPDYPKVVSFARGRCFPDYQTARRAYEQEEARLWEGV